MINTDEELLKLLRTSKIVAEFLAKIYSNYEFEINFNDDNGGTEHRYKVKGTILPNLMTISVNTSGFVDFKIEEVKNNGNKPRKKLSS